MFFLILIWSFPLLVYLDLNENEDLSEKKRKMIERLVLRFWEFGSRFDRKSDYMGKILYKFGR